MTYVPDAEVVETCRDLVRIDTSNYGDGSGPGERAAAEYVAAQLAEVGISAEIIESEPGRASLVAQWGAPRGTQNERPGLLLHGHLDVVPAFADQWQVDPFAAEIVDGYLYGRGTVDMKDFDAILLSVVRARQRAGAIPNRPITLVFTADEEAGSLLGAHWLVEHRPELFEGITEAVGEVGGFSVPVAGRRLYLIQTGEKGMAWLRLHAHGTQGHGSMANPDNAVTHLARSLVALADHEWPDDVGPSMKVLLEKVRELTGADGIDEVLEHFGPAARMIGAGLRNSTNATIAEAGFKHNVIPAEAVAYIDGRFLPGQEKPFRAEIDRIVGPRVDVSPHVLQPALEYAFEGDLVDAMTVSLHAEDPEAVVAPYLMSGGTDAKGWDRLGITCYGFAPLRLPDDLDFTALFHGIDERVPVDALEFGARVFDRFLDLARDSPYCRRMSAMTIVATVTAVLFAGAGIAKLVSATMSVEQRDALGVPPGLWRTIGVLEVLGALAVGATLLGWVPPWLGFAAAVGFVLLIIGAITTRARAKSPFGMVLADVVTLIMAILTLGAMRALAMG